MLMTAMVVNAQTKSAVQEVHDYLHECGVFYIATGWQRCLTENSTFRPERRKRYSSR